VRDENGDEPRVEKNELVIYKSYCYSRLAFKKRHNFETFEGVELNSVSLLPTASYAKVRGFL
jgi:hypothetical protein